MPVERNRVLHDLSFGLRQYLGDPEDFFVGQIWPVMVEHDHDASHLPLACREDLLPGAVLHRRIALPKYRFAERYYMVLEPPVVRKIQLEDSSDLQAWTGVDLAYWTTWIDREISLVGCVVEVEHLGISGDQRSLVSNEKSETRLLIPSPFM